MTGLLAAIIVAAAAVGPNATFYERDGVRIDVSVDTQIFAWTVTNVSVAPIVRFEIGNHHTYNFHAPEGWVATAGNDVVAFEAEGVYRAIQPGGSAQFTARVGSAGATLGLVPARVAMAARDEMIEFPGVWGPVPQPRRIVAVVAATLASVGILHAWWTGRRTAPRRRQ